MSIKYGSYEVEEIDRLWLEINDHDCLPLKIYSCKGSGTFPVIIFSHGAGASEDSYRYLGYFWSSHGYICVHPFHRDVDPEKAEKGKKRSFLKLMGQVLTDHKLWIKRTSEISLIIDSLSCLGEKDTRLIGKLDIENIGVAGHSFGAYTAQLLGGAKINIPGFPEKKSFLDQRISSLVLLSPQGKGQQGLNESSWDSMTLPFMIITGTLDKNFAGKGAQWRREPFDFAPPKDKYFVLLEGAEHFSFNGRGLEKMLPKPSNIKCDSDFKGQLNSNLRRDDLEIIISEKVQNLSLAFWNLYLKKDNLGQIYLNKIANEKDESEGTWLSIK